GATRPSGKRCWRARSSSASARIAAHWGAPALVPPTETRPWRDESTQVGSSVCPLSARFGRHESTTRTPLFSAALYETSGSSRCFACSERCHGGAEKIWLGAPPPAPGVPVNGSTSLHACSPP